MCQRPHSSIAARRPSEPGQDEHTKWTIAAGGGVAPHMVAEVRPTSGLTSDSAEKSQAGALATRSVGSAAQRRGASGARQGRASRSSTKRTCACIGIGRTGIGRLALGHWYEHRYWRIGNGPWVLGPLGHWYWGHWYWGHCYWAPPPRRRRASRSVAAPRRAAARGPLATAGAPGRRVRRRRPRSATALWPRPRPWANRRRRRRRRSTGGSHLLHAAAMRAGRAPPRAMRR